MLAAKACSLWQSVSKYAYGMEIGNLRVGKNISIKINNMHSYLDIIIPRINCSRFHMVKNYDVPLFQKGDFYVLGVSTSRSPTATVCHSNIILGSKSNSFTA